ncbi:hypothetical protein Dxin01_02425 [Deinococcus xinjiangensis]|uniref:DUF1778 domain-containing protein n=1 Tax=Deinococcus xinjiangensis TaxID=457454 RepID=A0ABP9VBR6_9DEIO
MTIPLKLQRLEARVSAEQKDVIARAAAASGLSITDFVVQSAYQAAMDSLARQRQWELSEQDARVFVDTLMNPPSPNAALRAAAKRSKERLGA